MITAAIIEYYVLLNHPQLGAILFRANSFSSPYHLLCATRSKTERARSQEILSTVIRDFQTTLCLENYYFFDRSYRTKMFQFHHVIDIRDEAALKLFDGWFLSKLRRCKLETSTQYRYRFRIIVSNLNSKSFLVSKILCFSYSLFFAIFFIHICVSLNNDLIFPKSVYLTRKKFTNGIKITIGFNAK